MEEAKPVKLILMPMYATRIFLYQEMQALVISYWSTIKEFKRLIDSRSFIM